MGSDIMLRGRMCSLGKDYSDSGFDRGENNKATFKLESYKDFPEDKG